MNREIDVNNVLVPELGVAITESFSEMYPIMNWYIFNKKDFEESRDGEVKEVLDFKTQLLNPYRRCVGGYKRDINIFFLLAEAMWIATGKKDVHFLTMFNKRMSDFSDDGKTFHAPYGYRLRHWGIRTEDSFIDDVFLEASKGYDQVIDAIRLFSENPNSRQVVLSIWNPNFDLGYKTKDIPCNDIIMMKIRGGKLITTIQNRSNDLHWGLPTNIFQFSFLTELMAGALGIELGTQTHNSQSLHIYKWNKTAKVMNDIFVKERDGEEVVGDMYKNYGAKEIKIDFNFSHEIPVNRFREIEYNLQTIIRNLFRIWSGDTEIDDEIQQLANFSSYLYSSYQILKIYLNYKVKIANAENDTEKDVARHIAISDIEVLEADTENYNWDVFMLAKNFFVSRLSNEMEHEYLGKL